MRDFIEKVGEGGREREREREREEMRELPLFSCSDSCNLWPESRKRKGYFQSLTCRRFSTNVSLFLLFQRKRGEKEEREIRGERKRKRAKRGEKKFPGNRNLILQLYPFPSPLYLHHRDKKYTFSTILLCRISFLLIAELRRKRKKRLCILTWIELCEFIFIT